MRTTGVFVLQVEPETSTMPARVSLALCRITEASFTSRDPA
jgi:hypothetical protein